MCMYVYIHIYIYIYIYMSSRSARSVCPCGDPWGTPLRLETEHAWAPIRSFFILRIVRPRIFESKFRNHCAKKLVGALRKPTSFM